MFVFSFVFSLMTVKNTETGHLYIVQIKMEYGKLLNLIPDSLKSKYRNYENLIKKYMNAELSKLFNSVSLKENLWPSYTYYNKLKRAN